MSRPFTRHGWRIAGVSIAFLVGLLALLLLLRLLLFQGPHRPVSELPDHRILDLHCHLAGIGAGNSGCFVSPELRANIRFRIYLDAFGVTESELSAKGDILVAQRLSEGISRSRHVGRAVVLALDGVMDAEGRLDTNRTEVFVPNEFVAAIAERHTNLLFGASINPYRIDALDRLDWAARHGAVLVKWIPSIMAINPADERLIPFYDRMQAHRLPLLCHTGSERSFTSSQDELADPERLRLALSRGVVVIAAHVGAGGKNGGERDFDRLRRLMVQFPNLYADISAHTQLNRLGVLQEVLEAPECHGRLLYGSDFPLINTALVSPWYFPLNLTEKQRQEIGELQNPWDRDVRLKQALGVPAEIFLRAESLIGAR